MVPQYIVGSQELYLHIVFGFSGIALENLQNSCQARAKNFSEPVLFNADQTCPEYGHCLLEHAGIPIVK